MLQKLNYRKKWLFSKSYNANERNSSLHVQSHTEIQSDFIAVRFLFISVKLNACFKTPNTDDASKNHLQTNTNQIHIRREKILCSLRCCFICENWKFNTRDTYIRLYDCLQQYHSTLWCLQNENKNTTPSLKLTVARMEWERKRYRQKLAHIACVWQQQTRRT